MPFVHASIQAQDAAQQLHKQETALLGGGPHPGLGPVFTQHGQRGLVKLQDIPGPRTQKHQLGGQIMDGFGGAVASFMDHRIQALLQDLLVFGHQICKDFRRRILHRLLAV